MKTVHPNDRQLEQYRKQRLGPELKWNVSAHVEVCPLCALRIRDMEKLERLLDSAAAESLPADFTSRLVADLKAEKRKMEVDQPIQEKSRLALRPELVNIIVAAAATYLFVASGALKAVVALDQTSLDTHVFSKLGMAFQVVGQWIGSFN